MALARTTITIKPSLLAQLKLFASRHNRTISGVIEEGVKQVINKPDTDQIEAMYEGLLELRKCMEGVEEDPRYAGMSVDEILYGENGAWRGSNREED